MFLPQKTNKKILIFQSVTNCHVLYCAWIIFINRNFKSRRHSYVAISLCGDHFILPLLFSRRYPFVKQTKHILAVRSILLYDYIILTSHHILIGVYVLHNFSTNTFTVFLKGVLIPDSFYSYICIPEIIYFEENQGLIMLTIMIYYYLFYGTGIWI